MHIYWGHRCKHFADGVSDENTRYLLLQVTFRVCRASVVPISLRTVDLTEPQEKVEAGGSVDLVRPRA